MKGRDSEEGLLMPMMAEDQNKGYTGYRILSQQSASPDDMVLEVEIGFTGAPTRKEKPEVRRLGGNWKVVIDEDFIKSAH